MQTSRILLVDDEPTILELYKTVLSSEYHVDTAENGAEGLSALAERGPFSVVVSDMQMPGINGTEFLRRVQEASPKSIRIMLTASSVQQVAVDAVNEGRIFSFLNKPCPPQRLAKAIAAGVEQYRLLTAERELLEDTLNGSLALLTEILSIVSPLAFGRATRAKNLVQKICNQLEIDNAWELSIAAMLSQVGCIALPESLIRKVQRKDALAADETRQYESHPQIGGDLVKRIPRMGKVADLILKQQIPFDSPEYDKVGREQGTIAERAGILKTALDYDSQYQRDLRPEKAIARMLQEEQLYPPRVLQTLAEIIGNERSQNVRNVTLAQLEPGMILESAIVDAAGSVLLTKDNVMTEFFLERLRHHKSSGRVIREPIRVLQSEMSPA